MIGPVPERSDAFVYVYRGLTLVLSLAGLCLLVYAAGIVIVAVV